MAGYTPEEIAAMRSKLVGGSSVGNFDKKASDVSASLSRLQDSPFARLAQGVANPVAPMLKDAAGQADLQRKGAPLDLSQKTQGALAEQVNSPGGTILRPMDTPLANVEAAPSLKDQLLAKLKGNAGGGGGDPFGGLRGAYMAARRRQLGDFEVDKELAGEQGVNRATRIMAEGELMRIDAAQKQRDAEIQQQADYNASKQHQAYLARNTELADDIGRQKIDPKRLVSNMSTGEKINNLVGSVLGGALSGLRGGPNEFVQRFDQKVAQDIQAQIDETDNKKASLGARQSIFGQMLAETGDRRLAALQTRNLMYEAAKQKLAADAADLGVPEVQTTAQQQIAALQHQQDAMNAQFSGEAYQQAVAAANARAAAQRAAENQAWQRQKDLIELGLKKDALEIDRMKALGGSPEDIQKQAQFLGDKLSDPKLAQGRAAVEASKARLDKAAPDEGLPGVGTGADLREKIAGRPEGLTALLPSAWLLNKTIGLSNEERVSRNDWAAVRQAYINQATGSGGSAEERADIIKTFQGAQSPAEQRAAIAKADAFFKQQETNLKAAVDPRAAAIVDQRKAAQLGVQPRQGNVSDERAKRFKEKLSRGGN